MPKTKMFRPWFLKATVIFKYCSWKDAVFIAPHKFIGGPGTPGKYCGFLTIIRSMDLSFLLYIKTLMKRAAIDLGFCLYYGKNPARNSYEI